MEKTDCPTAAVAIPVSMHVVHVAFSAYLSCIIPQAPDMHASAFYYIVSATPCLTFHETQQNVYLVYALTAFCSLVFYFSYTVLISPYKLAVCRCWFLPLNERT